ncbi:MAG: VWA domain-containing protein [Planctomycetota bacterium]
MFDSTLKIPTCYGRNRHGAIAPLFAVILPLLLIFAGFAINLAYMQLINTELKIATDATCHAGGRAMSLLQVRDASQSRQDNIQQTIDNVVEQCQLIAEENHVGGKVLQAGTGGRPNDIQLNFGRSIRGNGGYGMYEFTEIPLDQIISGAQRPSSLAVTGNSPFTSVFRMFKYKERVGEHPGSWKNKDGTGMLQAAVNEFNPIRRSIATQVDRDIALVLDRSGSMLWFKDETGLEDRLYELYNTRETVTEPGYWKYHYWRWSWRRYRWYSRGYFPYGQGPSNSYILDSWDRIWENGSTVQGDRLISWDEYQDATDWLYNRNYSDNVIYQLETYQNDDHTIGSSYNHYSERGALTRPMAEYAADWRYNYGSTAPKYSRWYYLALGVDAFLSVLDETDQEELVSLTTFSDNTSLDQDPQSTYNPIRDEIVDIFPNGGTAIGDGMLTGLPSIISDPIARPFAAKTIVVLSDGQSNSGTNPLDATDSIIASNNVTIHTVTFTLGADKDSMAEVASRGRGRHYHTDEGDELVDIFEEIANNLPTILTE